MSERLLTLAHVAAEAEAGGCTTSLPPSDHEQPFLARGPVPHDLTDPERVAGSVDEPVALRVRPRVTPKQLVLFGRAELPRPEPVAQGHAAESLQQVVAALFELAAGIAAVSQVIQRSREHLELNVVTADAEPLLAVADGVRDGPKLGEFSSNPPRVVLVRQPQSRHGRRIVSDQSRLAA